MFKNEFIFIDTETTGCRPTIDRITDIGFYHVIDNVIVAEWHQLINPETSIPPRIQQLTGITNEMVINAPIFAEIADDLAATLQSKILVAHNARFDYGFLKNEFKRAGIHFQTKTLCTVKLSRLLFPKERHHNLDAIAARYNLKVEQRHRALGDAKLLVDFFTHLINIFDAKQLSFTITKLLQEHSIPTHLSSKLIKELPQNAGVYFFYGENNSLLYIGKSNSLRTRVLSHFSADHSSHKEMQMAQQIRHIEWINTAGELGALLTEAQLIKQHKPIFNRKLRRYKNLFTIKKQMDKNHYHTLQIIPFNDVDTIDLSNTYGLFRRKDKAEELLRDIVKQHHLCPKLSGLEKASKACFYYQLHKCKGACINQENTAIYNLRVEMSLNSLENQPWPYTGKIAIQEICPLTERIDFHLVDHWHHLGTVNTEAALFEKTLSKKPIKFDADIYKILASYLNSKKQKIKIIELE